MQLVFQHCCKTSCKAMLRLLLPSSKAFNLLQDRFDLWVVKRATSLFNSRFAAVMQNKLHVFCCPFYRAFSEESLYKMKYIDVRQSSRAVRALEL